MLVRAALYERSPYEGLNLSNVEPDMQGWGSDHPVLRRAIFELKPKTIIEVGTWKGRSAINMARYCMEFGIRAEIVCIDTWLGSPEHWIFRKNKKWYRSLRIENGFPRIYWTSLKNVTENRAEHLITPFPNSSDSAYVVLEELGILADLIYIDAGHEHESVLRDLRNYWKLLRPGGALIGDDYVQGWPGVMKAAQDFAEEVEIELFDANSKFVFQKPPPNRPAFISDEATVATASARGAHAKRTLLGRAALRFLPRSFTGR
jgi:SAM-dependent methyltransferase